MSTDIITVGFCPQYGSSCFDPRADRGTLAIAVELAGRRDG
jgi:hypothetical protein